MSLMRERWQNISPFFQYEGIAVVTVGGVFVKLEVRLFAGLTCKNADLPCFGQGEFYLDAPDAITVHGLHELLKLGPIPLVTVVNGAVEKKDHPLSDNDRVGIFPPIAGGQPGSYSVSHGGSFSLSFDSLAGVSSVSIV